MDLIKVNISSCVITKSCLRVKQSLGWWSSFLNFFSFYLKQFRIPLCFLQNYDTLFWVCESSIFKTLLGLVWLVILLFYWLIGCNYDFLKAPFMHKYGICSSIGIWYGSITPVKLVKTFLKIKKINFFYLYQSKHNFLQDYLFLLKITRK